MEVPRSRPRTAVVLVALGTVLSASVGLAHFLVLLPSVDVITRSTGPAIDLSLTFTHPFEGGPAMPLADPVAFGVVVLGVTTDLSSSLAVTSVDGVRALRARFEARGPGDHLFYVSPSPYFEAAEAKAIVHHTKVIVNAYGLGEGWDEPIGLPVEILPLVRPYDVRVGNLFRGVVVHEGAPVASAVVEVEWLNDGSLDPSGVAFPTQVVKTDAAGTFAFALPRAGWWGFAALIDGEETVVGPDGAPWATELGGVLWVRAREVD